MLIGLLRPTHELPHVECAYAMYLIHVIAVWRNLSQKEGKRSPPFLWLALGPWGRRFKSSHPDHKLETGDSALKALSWS